MIYLDTNVFVFAVTQGGKTKDLLRDIALEKIDACTSVLTWDETVWTFKRIFGNYDAAKIEGKKMLRLPNIVVLSISIDIVEQAQQLIEAYPKLKPRDALHLATAINFRAETIISDDTDFDGIKEIKRVPAN
ncbi:type II toxin-antitoxin system VapC family toxin [Candidatus Woesearchaeota archaeon]|nr:type II toxin-antitoxin system VapC family toxin [Candidatus Woesearchaeota archaeon]